MKRRILLTLAAVAILCPACANPCEELAQVICACRSTESQRQACEEQSGRELDENGVTSGDEAFCQGKLDSCDCRELDTPQGKIDCGLAVPTP